MCARKPRSVWTGINRILRRARLVLARHMIGDCFAYLVTFSNGEESEGELSDGTYGIFCDS
jgi:hypothetical protein